tara:strand:+ start:558 stop:1481 length:924 start_codon:yes stop_codon:yes gene_type:complete
MKKFVFKQINCPICNKNETDFLGHNGGKYHPNKKGIESKIFRCKKCSLIFANPQPLPINIQEIYVDADNYFSYNATEDWEKRRNEHKKTIKKLLSFTEKKNKIDKVYKLLEIGSGRGEFLKCCQGFSNIDATGIEVSDDFIKFAKNKNIRIEKKELDQFIDENTKFDIVIMIAVIEHLANPDEYIKNINKVLEEDGIIYIDCPQEPNIVTILYSLVMKILRKKQCLNLQPTWQPYHLFGFNRKSIKKILNKYDFKILNISIWSPPKPSFKVNKKNFLIYLTIFLINIFGNLISLSQNMFVYARKINK